MKILSVSDVITNSSSEVFVIDKSLLPRLLKDIQDKFEVIDSSNFMEWFDDYRLEDLYGVCNIPEFFTGYDSHENISTLREIHTDEEILAFFEPLLKGILDKAVFEECDESTWGYNQIESVANALIEKHIPYKSDRV